MKIAKTLKISLKNLLSIQMGSVKTDKAELVWDGEENLKIGDEVFVLNEEGDAEPAADGDYTTEDGKVIKVVEGKVAEIVDPEAEVADNPVEEEIQQEENTPDENQEEIQQEENPEVDPADNADDQEEEQPLEDRVAGIEERIAAIMDGLNQFINSIAALEERLAVVEDKLAKVEEPAADPVDEQPEVQQSKNILNYLRKK